MYYLPFKTTGSLIVSIPDGFITRAISSNNSLLWINDTGGTTPHNTTSNVDSG